MEIVIIVKLKVKILGMSAGDKPIVVLNNDTAEDMGVISLNRIVLERGEKSVIGIVNTSKNVVGKGEIGLFDEIIKNMDLKNGMDISVKISSQPASIEHIKSRLKGRKLREDEIFEIVKDVVDNRLSEIEISTFVTSLNNHPMDIDEIVGMTRAMVKTGKTLELNSSYIVDKHSIGGVPGDKTTLLVVPIIAACGITIPKTSSRAITSAAGTGDRAETLMPVELSVEEMKTVVKKTNGCIVWEGHSN